jgi:hypothetical protein
MLRVDGSIYHQNIIFKRSQKIDLLPLINIVGLYFSLKIDKK